MLCGVLAVALAAYLLLPLMRAQPSGEVLITVDGREYARVKLEGSQEISIDCGDGQTNLLHVDASGMYMQSANCRDQLCVGQGAVTPENYAKRALGTDIICLPHRLVCSLVPAVPDPDATDE